MNLNEPRSAAPAQPRIGVLDGDDGQGVGARQGDLFATAGGGGYLNECTTSKVWEKTKLRELADMGMPSVWLRVAEAIGYDKFLIFWRILDTAAELREVRRSENESMIEVQLRRFSSYKRYQRNRYIETLASAGLPTAAIQDAVRQRLGEKLHVRHIRKLAKRGTIQP